MKDKRKPNIDNMQEYSMLSGLLISDTYVRITPVLSLHPPPRAPATLFRNARSNSALLKLAVCLYYAPPLRV